MKPSVRLRNCATVHVSLHKDVVQCVSSRLLSCPGDVFFLWLGRCAGCCTRDSTPPSPKGQQPASRHTRHLLPTSRAPMQKGVPELLVLSPFVFRGSRRQWVVSPRTRVSGAQPVEGNRPSRRQEPLEPETTKGNRPSCLQKFLDLEPSRATGPRVCNKSFCPRPQRATGPRVYKSSFITGPQWDNQSHRNPDLPVSFNKK